jgi:translation elongation factor EF-G
MRDLRERSGQLPALEPRDNTETVTVLAPLKAMLGYELVLNALSAGMAKLSMRYETHQEVALPEPPDDRFPSAMAMRA